MVPLLLAAPVQCPSEQEPRHALVEQPAEAVYRSAMNLRALGYSQAEEETLRYLIEQYPGSRWAERARLDLTHGAEPRP
jgi:outer membrane protein assembly factor BamD (BamD/ComL family)